MLGSRVGIVAGGAKISSDKPERFETPFRSSKRLSIFSFWAGCPIQKIHTRAVDARGTERAVSEPPLLQDLPRGKPHARKICCPLARLVKPDRLHVVFMAGVVFCTVE